MELHLYLTTVLFILLTFSEGTVLNRQKRDTYARQRNTPSFIRAAVEQPPYWTPSDRSASYRYQEYGSRALPLRTAVESIPKPVVSTRRLPLRDAVEKRPPPDEPFYNEKPIYRVNNFLSSPFQTPYSPFEHFKRVISWHYSFNPFPYRIDSEQQKVLNAKGRALNVDQSDGEKIVCYLQAASIYRKEPMNFHPDDLDPFACTHVIYAFASIDPHTFDMVSNDEEFDIVQGGYRSITGLKQINPKLKVLISIGESRQDRAHRFTTMVSSANKRRDFIRSVIRFIQKYEFDGIDIHWEHPGTEEYGGHLTDREYFNLFLEELSEIFKSKGWLLTVAVPASRFRVENGYNPKDMGDLVDFVNLQAYDFHRDRQPVADHHANLMIRPRDEGPDIFLSVEYAVNFWLRKGFPRSKLVVGLPFFGRSFTLQFANETEVGSPIKGPGKEGFYTQQPGMLAYFEICDLLLNEGWHKHYDQSGSPYIVYGDQWVGYDDVGSIEQKISFIRNMKLGGAFVWAADFDDFSGICGEKWPLLRAVSRHLKGEDTYYYNHPIKPYGVCENTGLYSDPKNCVAYYICRNKLAYHLSCGEDRMFDPETGRCIAMVPEKCKPGETIYIANSLKHLDSSVRANLVDDKPKVVCYMTSWSFYRKAEGKFVPEHIDQRLCTHVVYAFASLDPEKLLMKEFDPWVDLDNNLYERVTSLTDIKVLLSLGGWTDSVGDKYSRLVSDGSARRKFVVGVVSFLRRHHFDGLHIDWNYPVCWQSNCRKGPASDKPNFTKLIQELRKEFDKQMPRMILAAAISGYKEVIDVSYDLNSLGQALDFMSVMTYDYHGAWERQTGHVSPLYQKPGDKHPQYNSNFTMNYLVAKGAPREKLLMGIPFYGQTFTLAKSGNQGLGVPSAGPGEPGEYTKQPGMLAYYEICNRIKNNRWIMNRDPDVGPYAYQKDQWVGFEDIDSVRKKARYIKEQGFGGAVAWTIDLDDFNNRCCGGSFPLLSSLNRGLGLIPDEPSKEDCSKPPEPVTPAPPQTTTGIDSGASSTTEHMHHHEWTSTTNKPSTWWSQSSTTSTTTTMKPSTWWSQPSTTSTTTKKPSTWWSQGSTTSTTSTTTMKPSTWWSQFVTSTTTTTSTTRPTEGTTIPTPAVVMPEIESPTQSCEPGQYKPDPQNCNAYYRCILGELKKQFCAGGLHWNKDRNVCDWPAVAKCEANKIKPTKKPTQGGQTKTTPMPTIITTPTTTTKKPLIIEMDEEEQKCVNGQYYPHTHCSSYFICVNGNLVMQSCPPSLNWNVEKGTCDWKFKVNCNNRRNLFQEFTGRLVAHSDHKPQPYSSCDENSFSSYPGDCAKYLHCLWGKYQVFQCSPGLHWNTDRKTCDWPKTANCDENNDIDTPLEDAEPLEPSSTPSSTMKPQETSPPYVPSQMTTKRPETTTILKPTTTTENSWEWHPPIPPTSEQPPLPEPLKPHSGYFKVVCYFTNWAWYRRGIGKYLPEDIDPDLCTHIIYGFAVLDYSNLVIKAHDSWADFDNQFYKRVTGWKSKGIKVLIAIGGWNDSQGDKYSRLVNNPSARARFITNVVEFIEKHNFDGLDLDWEYPKCWQVDCKKGPDSDKQAFSDWVRELKQAFKPKGYLLSAAVSPSKTVIDAGYEPKVLGEYLDWVSVMTYDFHGQWDKQTGHVAPLYYHPDDEVAFFNANYSIHYWISEGVPRRKIVMGMPLYGQSFQLENETNNGLNAKAPGPGQAGEYTRAAGFLAYYEICDNIKNKGWTVVKDEKRRMGPYAYKGNQWVSFDDKEMIKIKSDYIRNMNLGGGMIWALDLDDFKNRCGEGRHPLLTIIRNTLADSPVRIPPQVLAPYPVENEKEQEEVEVTTLSKIETTSKPVPSTTTTATPIVNPNSEYKVVCYFTNWAWYRQGPGKYLPSDIDPDLCTHIIYGFAVLNNDQLIIKPHDTWADYDNKFYEKVTAYKAKGIKVLIAIGGWNDSAGDKYSKLVNSPSARRRFISHVIEFIEANNFDGLDLDWEYPKCWQVDCNKGPDSDKMAFAEFVEELHHAFQPKGFLLSAAVSPSKRVIDSGYEVPALSKYLDWISVMTYDYHGQWDKITGHVAPMYPHPDDIDATFNANFTINYWIEKGADRKKIVMGMPMYGQSFSLAENNENGLNAPTYGGGEAGEETRARGFLAYYEICQNIIKKGWKVVRDKKGRMGPYAYLRDQWVSFDDIGMIRHKSEYIKAMGLGGGMIWALDLDDFRNLCGCEEYPLLRTINRVLRDYAKPDPKCVLKSSSTPTTEKPQTTTTSWWPTPEDHPINPEPQPLPQPIGTQACNGQLFVADKNNCNNYYLCNQGLLQLQSCPNGLYWNRDHCDWPENTPCHPDATTQTPNSKLITKGDNNDYKVICYFTNWAWYRPNKGKYIPQDIDPSLCTHIMYGFATLDSSSLTIRPYDIWADLDNKFYEIVTSYQKLGIKVLISIGGWNDSEGDKYSRLVNNPEARANFIKDVIGFIEKYNFDGLDLDWEYPKCWQTDCNRGPDSDKEGFVDWVKELRKAFDPKGLLLSAAVSPSKLVIDEGYDVPQLSQYLDWIDVMTFDYHGNWDRKTGHVSPLYYYPGDDYDYFNTNFSVHYWVEKGLDPKKLVMGFPMYGQTFTLANPSNHGLKAPTNGPGEAGEFTRAAGFLSYYEICDKVQNEGWKVVRDPQGRIGPYAYSGNQWVSYDDSIQVKRKAEFVRSLDLGGSMIWALDLDDFMNSCGCGNYPLLTTINNELRGIKDGTLQQCP